MRWHSRGELMFRDRREFATRIRSSKGPECHPPGLPMKRMRDHSGGQRKAKSIFRKVKRLNHILRVLTAGITPTSDLDIHFAVVGLAFRVVVRKHAEDRGRLQSR